MGERGGGGGGGCSGAPGWVPTEAYSHAYSGGREGGCGRRGRRMEFLRQLPPSFLPSPYPPWSRADPSCLLLPAYITPCHIAEFCTSLSICCGNDTGSGSLQCRSPHMRVNGVSSDIHIAISPSLHPEVITEIQTRFSQTDVPPILTVNTQL